MKKKILILSHTGPFSDFKIGSHHYADKLSEVGYDIYFSGVPRSFLHWLLKKKATGSKKVNKHVKCLHFNSVLPITFKDLLLNTLLNKLYWSLKGYKKKLPDFDLVICDYPYFSPILPMICYKKLIYRPTDDYRSMSGSKVIPYEKDIIKNATEIICTSRVVKEALLDRYKNIGITPYVIENGYDSDVFFEIDNDKRAGCVYVGSLDDRFSYDDITTLSKNYPAVQFDIFGPTDFSDINVINLSQRSNVSFKGALDYEKVAGVLNNYKIGILPLTKNVKNLGRSPMKLWEYYHCGLNVVYTNISHIDNSVFFEYGRSPEMDINRVFGMALSYDRNKSYNKESGENENSWHYKIKQIINISNLDT